MVNNMRRASVSGIAQSLGNALFDFRDRMSRRPLGMGYPAVPMTAQLHKFAAKRRDLAGKSNFGGNCLRVITPDGVSIHLFQNITGCELHDCSDMKSGVPFEHAPAGQSLPIDTGGGAIGETCERIGEIIP